MGGGFRIEQNADSSESEGRRGGGSGGGLSLTESSVPMQITRVLALSC